MCLIYKSTLHQSPHSLSLPPSHPLSLPLPLFLSLSLSLDYELFAIMVTGRTLQMHRKMFFSAVPTRQDVLAVKDTFFSRMDDVINILHILPSSMILVFR